MAFSRPSKKSETLEIRLSHEAKTAFMERCRQERRTASDAIRLFIDAQLDPESAGPRRLPSWRIVVAGAIGAALGLGVAAPSFAHATENSRAAFEKLDRNHDGVVSYQESRSR
ncbi:MAG TPA: EF-hand domain-containing protein [Allosphingosinicella sp.]|jgi:hypothetical protein|nr:EF-hand domain-containing protein [Allosphingosinicella sp.]